MRQNGRSRKVRDLSERKQGRSLQSNVLISLKVVTVKMNILDLRERNRSKQRLFENLHGVRRSNRMRRHFQMMKK